MKILHVMPAFFPAHVYGGPIASVFALCRQLGRLDHEVRVLTSNANGTREVLNVETGREVELTGGLRVRYCKRWRPVAVAPRLAGLLPSYVRWADVVHLTAVYSFPTIPTLVACRLLAKPLVWSPRGALKRWSGTRHRLGKAIWETACRLTVPERLLLHATSEDEARESLERLPGVDVIVVPNGVDAAEPAARRPRADTLRLLYLGRLDPIKGIENLLAGCALLDRYGLAWSLTIAGDGESSYAARLRGEIERRSLHARVAMVGDVRGAAKARLFANADLAVVPSHSENFGMVVAEALASAVPVVASRGTPWRRVEAVGCGAWVDNSPESLAAAVASLATRPLEEMGRRGRAWMRREFSWEARARQMLVAYERLLGIPRTGRPTGPVALTSR